VTVPAEKVSVDVAEVMKHLEQMLLIHIREIAVCRARIDQLESENEELQRQVRVSEASKVVDLKSS
jgi:hypothetical protein